ncbi:hypothetical protein ANN_08590 [Periplaneta americana]|uniref:Uncharacterized protein n=1 Tax=Periplaneta americana TaxID=6978 RepID=A0ABQ8T315_PERAM|nr:hypothetical protein ANN_08590 [Periplaneta americana]
MEPLTSEWAEPVSSGVYCGLHRLTALRKTILMGLKRSEEGSVTVPDVEEYALRNTVVIISISPLISHYLQDNTSMIVSGPPVSPDLTASDFFLWGYLKAKVYARRLPDINSLKNAMGEEIVTPDTLQRIMTTTIATCVAQLADSLACWFVAALGLGLDSHLG